MIGGAARAALVTTVSAGRKSAGEITDRLIHT
jgi:hypothetical protein